MARLGYDVAETSHYGPEVVEAVRQFQRDRGLRPDGVVDRFTWVHNWLIFQYHRVRAQPKSRVLRGWPNGRAELWYRFSVQMS
jgi:peptidoglycan hydrolase-like protein with peptidoglycan-binding domain